MATPSHHPADATNPTLTNLTTHSVAMSSFDTILAELDGAYAPATLDAYRKDLRRLARWGAASGCDVLHLGVDDYVAYLNETGDALGMSTIRRAHHALRTVFHFGGLAHPLDHPKVTLALRRLARQKGTAQQQAKPLTQALIKELLRGIDPATVVGLRDTVLLHLGYETMRRRAELVRFRFSDLRQSEHGQQGLWLQSSKTDQVGQGRILVISEALHRQLMHWYPFAGDGRILRAVTKDGRITECLTPDSVNRILKRLERAHLKKPIGLSGHSFRVGRTVDLIAEGATIEQITLHGGWSSHETAYRYGHSWRDAAQGAPAPVSWAADRGV